MKRLGEGRGMSKQSTEDFESGETIP